MHTTQCPLCAGKEHGASSSLVLMLYPLTLTIPFSDNFAFCWGEGERYSKAGCSSPKAPLLEVVKPTCVSLNNSETEEAPPLQWRQFASHYEPKWVPCESLLVTFTGNWSVSLSDSLPRQLHNSRGCFSAIPSSLYQVIFSWQTDLGMNLPFYLESYCFWKI